MTPGGAAAAAVARRRPRRTFLSTLRRASGLLAVLALAGGCASTPPLAPDDDDRAAYLAHEARLAPLQGWRLVARIRFVTEERGGSLIVNWRQRDETFEINLLTPFGRGLLRLTGDGRQAELLTPGGERLSASDPETLFAEHLGLTVPVEPLSRWVLGLAAEGDVFEVGPGGRLVSLLHDEWSVLFLSYARVEGVELPDRLRLRRDGLELTLDTPQWELQWALARRD